MSLGNFKFVIVSDVDMSQRPEGATHFGPATKSYSESWFKSTDEGFERWNGTRWGAAGHLLAERFATLIECEAHADQAWTGEGPPPIGKATCEYRGAHQYDVWTVVNIFAHWGKDIFVDYGDGWRAERDLERFRPIRTPEQIATEKREASAVDLFRSVMNSPKSCSWSDLGEERREHYRNLIDQGWQKVPRA